MVKVVCLDPGHNRMSVNRSPDGSYYEWEFTQDVCDKAEEMIRRIPGLDSVKTKEAETYPTSLEGRVKVARDARADLFLSQHSNAYGSGGEWTSPNGFGVYRYPGRDLALAQIGLKWCLELLDMNNRGIREANFYVLRETPMPAILFETGFHTNREDVAKLKSQDFRIRAAKVLVRTACEFLGVPYVEGDEEMTRHYIVQPGDSMYRIAQRNNIPLAQLIRMNSHIEDPNNIYWEHGGDIIFLEEPSALSHDYAALRRKLILCKKYESSSEEVARLKAIGRQIHELAAEFL